MRIPESRKYLLVVSEILVFGIRVIKIRNLEKKPYGIPNSGLGIRKLEKQPIAIQNSLR